MRNIHVIATEKASKVISNGKVLILLPVANGYKPWQGLINRHIYITSDDEIKEGDWFYDGDGELCKYVSDYVVNPCGWNDNKKIILTTDPDLIKDGVQTIDDELLEWFVNNPMCEKVEIKMENYYASGALQPNLWQHKIIIPRGEPI